MNTPTSPEKKDGSPPATSSAALASYDNQTRLLACLIEASPGVLYVFDEQGRFLRWNHALEEVTGRAQEIARLHLLDLIAPEDRAAVEAGMREAFERGMASIEGRLLNQEGTPILHLFSGRRVELDGRACLVGVGLDISSERAATRARERAEESLRALRGEQEQIINARTEHLATALSQAESADKLKSAFLATMSHELRTPLNSILGFTGILLQRMAGPLTPEQEKQLKMVRSSARHLLDLINDVLDLSKIEAGQLVVQFEELDIASSIERVAESIRPLAAKKGLQLEVEAPVALGAVRSDRRRLEQILLNLLNNAVKFTESGSVRIVASKVNSHPGLPGVDTVVLVAIEDTGIGIRQQDLASLFQPFHQLDCGLTRQHEGTGLGLAICARLANLLGGKVEVESTHRRGSRFTLILPAASHP